MHSIHLVAINVRSALNVGSFFRTADAFGVEKVWLAGYTPTPNHASVKKTALGAEMTVKWESVPDAIACLERLRADGIKLIALECGVPRTISLRDVEIDGPCAIVVGNEVDGLSRLQMEKCDIIAEIPQVGTKESLNVSVTAGIGIWHLLGL
ncbi:MAG: TrmH family RNA methyltransferase [Patescibacteria group bacterium]